MDRVMRRDIYTFDTSDYPETNPFNMPRTNKKIVGLMKDECNGEIMLEFVGLRSKMYSVKVQNQKPLKKDKGVKGSIDKATICFDDYTKCLRENVIISGKQRNIRSRHHNINTEKEKRIYLSACDDKRCLQPGTTDTLLWSHYREGVVVEERVNEDGTVREGECEPLNSVDLPLYNAAVREQELIRTVNSRSHTLQQQQYQQISASPPTVCHQISTDSLPTALQPLLAITQPLPAEALLVLKRPCELTTGSSKKRREI